MILCSMCNKAGQVDDFKFHPDTYSQVCASCFTRVVLAGDSGKFRERLGELNAMIESERESLDIEFGSIPMMELRVAIWKVANIRRCSDCNGTGTIKRPNNFTTLLLPCVPCRGTGRLAD